MPTTEWVYTLLLTYEGLEDKIWRRVQVVSSFSLERLGYLALATFEAEMSHLFGFEYQGQRFRMPDEEMEGQDVREVTLKQLNMQVGDRLCMTYDFGLDHTFVFELQSVELKEKDQPKNSYPRVADGAGRGILEDVHVTELQAFIERIDRGEQVSLAELFGEEEDCEDCEDEDFEDEPWDYRQFDLEENDALVRRAIPHIARMYKPLWEE